MLKKDLKNVIITALLFALIYFLIGAYLRSDGPKIDLNKVYELIRDSLTLTAYFLAPIAAFIIYNKWKVEHVEKRLEIESEDIVKAIEENARAVNNLRNLIEDPLIYNAENQSEVGIKFETLDFTAHIIKSRLERLQANTENQQVFIEKGKNIVTLMVESLVLINRLIKINGDPSRRKEFNPNAKKLNEDLDILKLEIIKLSQLTTSFRIKY